MNFIVGFYFDWQVGGPMGTLKLLLYLVLQLYIGIGTET